MDERVHGGSRHPNDPATVRRSLLIQVIMFSDRERLTALKDVERALRRLNEKERQRALYGGCQPQ